MVANSGYLFGIRACYRSGAAGTMDTIAPERHSNTGRTDLECNLLVVLTQVVPVATRMSLRIHTCTSEIVTHEEGVKFESFTNVND